MHSVCSHGGELTPESLAAEARAAGLDFLAATEHNSADTHGTWGRYGGDDLLVILGQEVTTRTGHWLALGVRYGQVVDWRYGVRDEVIDRHLDEVRRGGGLCVVAHPHAPYDSGTFLYPHEGFDAVEVWNGAWSSDLPWQADNEAALAEWGRCLEADVRRGAWRPAMGNSDAHLSGQIGVPHTVVRAGELSTAAVLAGIRAGRSWIAGSVDVELSFEVLRVLNELVSVSSWSALTDRWWLGRVCVGCLRGWSVFTPSGEDPRCFAVCCGRGRGGVAY